MSELLEEACELASEHAGELRCERELALLPGLIERGGGAGRQRAAFQIAGMDGLLRELTELTGGGLGAKGAV